MSFDFPPPSAPLVRGYRGPNLQIDNVKDSYDYNSVERVAMGRLVGSNLREDKVADYEKRADEYDAFVSCRFKTRVATAIAGLATTALVIAALVVNPLISIAALFTFVGAVVGTYYSLQSKENPYETLGNPIMRENLMRELAATPFSQIDRVLKGQKRNGINEEAITYGLLPLKADGVTAYLLWEQLVEKAQILDGWKKKQTNAVQDIYDDTVAPFKKWRQESMENLRVQGADADVEKSRVQSYYQRGMGPIDYWRGERYGQIEAQYKAAMDEINQKWDEIKRVHFQAAKSR